MVQQLPIIIVEDSLIFQSLCRIFVDMTPFTSVRNFVVRDRVLRLQFHCLLRLSLFDLLTALVLVDDSLCHSRHKPILTLRFISKQLLELLVKLIFSCHLANMWKISNFLFECSARINIIC